MKIKLAFLLVLMIVGITKNLKAQEVKINTDLTVESDGTVKLTNNATVWDDIMVYPDATTRSGSNPPLWALFMENALGTSQGVFLYMFDKDAERELYFTVQIPHGYKLASTLYPHVHWTTSSGTPSATNVTWALEYTVVNIGGTFSTTTTISNSTIIPSITPSGTNQHLITSLGTISGTGLGISSIIICRLYRAAALGTDTFGNPAGLLGFDIHYEQDTQGSRQEFIK